MRKQSEPRVLLRTLGTILKKWGFVRRGRVWYKKNAETVLVVYLQRSRWGPDYSVNLGVSIRLLDDRPFPKPHLCHVQLSESVVPGVNSDLITQCLRLDDDSLTDDQREAVLAQELELHLLPFLKRCESLAGLGELLRDGALENALIFKEVREILSP